MNASAAAIVAVTRSEPVARLRRMLEGCAAQTVRAPVYIAAPDADADAIQAASDGLPIDVQHVSNPDGGRSIGLNRAIRDADRPIVCRLDARTQASADYVARCLSGLEDPTVGVVGGVQLPVPGQETRTARAIARALANPYVVGAAPYRLGARSGPVDTVYLGAFRRDELLELGGYAEDLDANEDFELATRYRNHGMQVWLDAGMVHRYEARSTIGGVVAQYRAFGRAKTVYWRRTGQRPNARQAVAIAGVSAGISLMIGSRHRSRLALAGLGIVAAVDHFGASERAEPSVRAIALAIEGITPIVWVAGIYEELARAPRGSQPTSVR